MRRERNARTNGAWAPAISNRAVRPEALVVHRALEATVEAIGDPGDEFARAGAENTKTRGRRPAGSRGQQLPGVWAEAEAAVERRLGPVGPLYHVGEVRLGEMAFGVGLYPGAWDIVVGMIFYRRSKSK